MRLFALRHKPTGKFLRVEALEDDRKVITRLSYVTRIKMYRGSVHLNHKLHTWLSAGYRVRIPMI